MVQYGSLHDYSLQGETPKTLKEIHSFHFYACLVTCYHFSVCLMEWIAPSLQVQGETPKTLKEIHRFHFYACLVTCYHFSVCPMKWIAP